MRTETFLLLVSAIILSSGCAYSNAGDAEQLAELATQADKSTYKVKYNFTMEGTALIGQSTEKAVLTAYKEDTRFDRTFNYLQGRTEVSIYNMNGRQSMRCTTSFNANNTSTDCSLSNLTASRYIEGSRYANKNYSVNYVEEKTYAGRTCELYRIGLPPSEFENSSAINTGAIVDLCLDTEKGYVAYNSMELAGQISTTGGNVTTLYTLKALNYGSEVNQSQIVPPETEEGNSTET